MKSLRRARERGADARSPCEAASHAPSASALRESILLALARRDKSNQEETFQQITAAAAVVLDIARVSIWELVDREVPHAERIVCKDLYLQSEDKHVSYPPIHREEFPRYFDALHERRTISADDARNDPRTSEFAEHYCKPLGITSMLDTPIWHHGQVYGVLCFEHVGRVRQWRADEQAFAVNMADIASSCLEAAEHASETRRWETVIECLSEGVAVLDVNGQLVQCNRALRTNMLERSGVKTWGELLASIDLVDASDAPVPGVDQPFQRGLRREKIQDEIYGLVFKRTGERRYIRLTCSPIIEGGQVRYLAFVVCDVTDEMRVERLKSDLLSGVAHELKTPLAIAKGYAQQLESKKATPEKGDRMLEAIIRACDRIDHLSETLLDLAGMMMGRLRLTRERVDLAELALGVIRRVERAAPGHHFHLKLRPNVFVVVDSARISEALRHVAENAVQYSAAGTTIEVELFTGEAQVTLSVRDQGVGIASGTDVFALFPKPAPGTARARTGLGVGLFLAREIIRRHGGDMWFESELGKGSTFYFCLPLARSS